MRKIVDDCRGCGACLMVCSKNAIQFKRDDDGFFTALIDEGLCIGCGLCTSICLKTIKDIPPINKNEVYVANTKNLEVLKLSSSGGIGYQLAEYFIENESYACGAIYDTKCNGVKHMIADNKEDLHLLQGSKYLQSDISSITEKIVTGFFCEGIIFGTPCQIAGFHQALKQLRKRHKYVLVDIFCHGVPSALLWKNHLTFIKKKYKFSKIQDVKFRIGKKYILTINNKYRKSCQYDAFYFFYLRKLVMNRSCYDCPYHRSSFSDIRIGDFMTKKYMNLPFSPSVIVVNTDKGMEILESLKPDIEIEREEYKNVDLIQDDGITPIPPNYERYLADLRNGKSPAHIAQIGLFFAHIKGYIKQLLKIQI